MNYISEGVYIGNVDDAYQTDKLKGEGITHILTLDTKPLRKEATDGKIPLCICLPHFNSDFKFTIR